MLKIYDAINLNGDIILKDYIEFNKLGRFYTGIHGYGDVISVNNSCKKANYELQTLKTYEQYLKEITTKDGFVENFMIFNPKTYEMLLEEYKNVPKNFETYEEYGLNEEAILLFTNWVNVTYEKNDLVQRVFGRFPEVSLYLLKPDATISISSSIGDSKHENYEVLQSKNLGKRLVLQKMDRKI